MKTRKKIIPLKSRVWLRWRWKNYQHGRGQGRKHQNARTTANSPHKSGNDPIEFTHSSGIFSVIDSCGELVFTVERMVTKSADIITEIQITGATINSIWALNKLPKCWTSSLIAQQCRMTQHRKMKLVIRDGVKITTRRNKSSPSRNSFM